MACRFANRVVTGFHACIFFAAAYLIRRTGATKTQKMKQGAVLLVLFTLGTIRISCNSEFFEMMFVDDRDFPGGPTAWLLAKYSIAVNAIGTTAFVIADIVTSTIVVSVVLSRLTGVHYLTSAILLDAGLSPLDHFQSKLPRHRGALLGLGYKYW